MKKIFFGIVALVAISFTTSCNGTGKGDVDIDSVNADTIVTAAPEANGVEADVTATISALSLYVLNKIVFYFPLIYKSKYFQYHVISSVTVFWDIIIISYILYKLAKPNYSSQ